MNLRFENEYENKLNLISEARFYVEASVKGGDEEKIGPSVSRLMGMKESGNLNSEGLASALGWSYFNEN